MDFIIVGVTALFLAYVIKKTHKEKIILKNKYTQTDHVILYPASPTLSMSISISDDFPFVINDNYLNI